MTYEKKSVIELREIAKERKIKGISTLKKQELIKVLENYDQEQSKQKAWIAEHTAEITHLERRLKIMAENK